MIQLNFGSTNGVPNDPNKTVVQCSMRELAQTVIDIYYKDAPDMKKGLLDGHDIYGPEYCLNLRGNAYARIRDYKEWGYTILPAEEFISLNTAGKPHWSSLHVGDRVFVSDYLFGKILEVKDTYSLIQFNTGIKRTIPNCFISFTEYTLQGFSQERPMELNFDASCLPAWANWLYLDRDDFWYWSQYKPEFNRDYISLNEASLYGIVTVPFTPKNYTGSWQDSLHEIKDGKAVKYSPKTAEVK